MKITRLTYSALFNLGDYENERIGLSVQLEDEETPESVVPQLREKALQLAGPKLSKLYHQRDKLARENRQLEEKLHKARENWNATAEFLRAQGIKADAPNFPELLKLLPSAAAEEVVAEVVEDDELNEDEETPF